MVLLKKNHHRLLQFVPVAGLIIVSLGFFALWQQEQMVRTWTAAEGTVIYLEIPEAIVQSQNSIDDIDVVFNYMVDNRVYQGKVQLLQLDKIKIDFHTSSDTEDIDIVDWFTPAINFFLNAEADSVYDFGDEQIVHIRSFDGTRQMRIPFDLAPRLQLYHHELTPERYRLDTAYVSMAIYYGSGFIISLVIIVALCVIFYLRDRESMRSSK